MPVRPVRAWHFRALIRVSEPSHYGAARGRPRRSEQPQLLPVPGRPSQRSGHRRPPYGIVMLSLWHGAEANQHHGR